MQLHNIKRATNVTTCEWTVENTAERLVRLQCCNVASDHTYSEGALTWIQ